MVLLTVKCLSARRSAGSFTGQFAFCSLATFKSLIVLSVADADRVTASAFLKNLSLLRDKTVLLTPATVCCASNSAHRCNGRRGRRSIFRRLHPEHLFRLSVAVVIAASPGEHHERLGIRSPASHAIATAPKAEQPCNGKSSADCAVDRPGLRSHSET